MKQELHPHYGPVAIRCACGNVIETGSTAKGDIQVEICSSCHPFFTGKQRVMDTAGRIDRFKKKFGDKLNVVTPKKVKMPSAEKPVLKKEEPKKAEPKKEAKKEVPKENKA